MIQAKRICNHAGCLALTTEGRCAKHKREQWKGTSKNRSGDPFYSSIAWVRLRNWKREENPLCEACESQGVTKAMAHVDHIKPRCDYPELEFDRENLMSLCGSCHNRKTAREQAKKRRQNQ